MAIDPSSTNDVYAGTETTGVFKSENAGGSWTKKINGLGANLNVQALAINPDIAGTIYAGTNGGGVFKSTDGGASWSDSNDANLTNTANVQTLAIDPDDTDIIYAGTDSGSLFISMDGGGSWSDISGSISGANVLSVAIDPDTTTTLYAGTAGEGLFKLTERGESSTTDGSTGGGGCFIESAAFGSPLSPQAPLSHLVATILIISSFLVAMTIALLYLLRRLQPCWIVFEGEKVKKEIYHGMPILPRQQHRGDRLPAN